MYFGATRFLAVSDNETDQNLMQQLSESVAKLSAIDWDYLSGDHALFVTYAAEAVNVTRILKHFSASFDRYDLQDYAKGESSTAITEEIDRFFAANKL